MSLCHPRRRYHPKHSSWSVPFSRPIVCQKTKMYGVFNLEEIDLEDVPGGIEGLGQRCQQMLDVMQTRPATLINSIIQGYLVRRQDPRMVHRRLCPTAYRGLGG
mmetsp:Transcript_8075/g.13367  ORF Transcript_8075/g.13367 Transcript_8075/m.13367 type:complete len:104 (-) Transcript_8075:112-423(-)